ncbi:MAG: serine/threonine-protein kinase [Planctomycetota bacterium]|nr:serine/threonine-protein kinase [Planctomycetota bacterium]
MRSKLPPLPIRPSQGTDKRCFTKNQDVNRIMASNDNENFVDTEFAESGFADADTIMEDLNPGSTRDDATLDTTPDKPLGSPRSSQNPPNPIRQGELFDGYVLLKALGTGSFGVVFKASKDGQIEGRPYLALEFIAGLSLRQSMKAGDYPSFDEARAMMSAVASGLAHCHSKGIVHRDLKPGNIIIEKDSGRPVIVDFGLVYKDQRRLRSEDLLGFTKNLSIKGFIKGTPQFMSPEQADPERLGAVGAASDVWSFGATLYNLLTQELLFPNHRGLEVLEPLANGRIPKIQSVKPETPRSLAQLCQLCLQLESIHRPTMFELAKFLKGSEKAFHERRVTGVLTPPKQKTASLPLIPMVLVLGSIITFTMLYYYVV